MGRRFKVGLRVWVGIAVLTGAVVLSAPSAFGNGAASKPAVAKKQAALPGDIAKGYQVFNDFFCAACHRLKQGGPMAYGQLGVNLNKKPVPYATARAVVINGLPAALPLYPTQMVGYKGALTEAQIRDVSSFVAKYAGKPKVPCSECPAATP
jgi:mono/diheme cytochrome c family protein